MNTFKKLMFGLLLSGMAFTAACGDDGVKPGAACKKADECGELKCVIKNAGDKSGTCEKPCTTANVKKDCTDSKKATCGGAIAFGKKDTDPKVNVCMAGATVKPGTAELGAPCDASGDADKTCKPNAGLACYQGKCYETCTSAADEAGATSCNGKHSGANKTALAPDCKVDGDTKVCVEAAAGPAKKLVEGGEGCEANATDVAKTCDDGLTCVVMTVGSEEKSFCMKECPMKGANKSECQGGKEGFVNCVEGAKKKSDNTTVVNVCYAGHAAHGEECDAASGDPTKLCVKTDVCDSTVNKCLQSCSAAGQDAECSAATTEDKSTSAPHCTEVAGVVACRA